MTCFSLGDYVEIVGLPGSQWQNCQGAVVEILDRALYEQEITQECGVDIEGERHWFMATHLVKIVRPRLIRFFRAEILERWHLRPNDVDGLKGDRQGLVGLLCDRLSFAMRRAEAEVEDFYIEFNERIARAIDLQATK